MHLVIHWVIVIKYIERKPRITNNGLFDALSKQYFALIEKIIAENIKYTNIDRTIQWCFVAHTSPEITATVNRKTNLLSVNIAFIDKEFKENRIYVIEYFLLHEMRHISQHIEIEKYKTGDNTISPLFIKRWINEGENYERALDEQGRENPNYPKQDNELDAYAFAYAVMHYKYQGMYDSLLYIPKIYNNELKENFYSAVNDFLENI